MIPTPLFSDVESVSDNISNIDKAGVNHSSSQKVRYDAPQSCIFDLLFIIVWVIFYYVLVHSVIFQRVEDSSSISILTVSLDGPWVSFPTEAKVLSFLMACLIQASCRPSPQPGALWVWQCQCPSVLNISHCMPQIHTSSPLQRPGRLLERLHVKGDLRLSVCTILTN